MKVSEYDYLPEKAPTHWGWSHPTVRLPHDRLSADLLSGPCRTYHLGKPMTMHQLQAMPADLQRQYLRKLRAMGAGVEDVAKMLGVSPRKVRTLGVRFDRPDPKSWAEFVKLC